MSRRPPEPEPYGYLLGLYLGDGYLQPHGASAQLLIVCDRAYPELVEGCAHAMRVCSGRSEVSVRAHRVDRCARVTCSWKGWLEAFPQHGPGRKHERPIVLEPWQAAIVEAQPWAFLRGLLHSDGCRTVNRFRTRHSGRMAEYAYPRWFFSNRSDDIRGLFRASCDQVGVRWTRSNARNVSVAHRGSVALLDEHVGPKR